MKCPRCGESRSTVLETRGTDSAITIRRRECFNLHRFTTYEVSEKLGRTIAAQAEAHSRGADTAAKLHKRNMQIVREVRKGASMKEVARRLGLAPTTVGYVIKKNAPELRRKIKNANS